MDDIIKNNSTKHAPNGKIPPKKIVNIGFKYQLCIGICLGILDVCTGNSIASFLYPKYAPKKTNGTEIPNHRVNTASIDKNGTAPVEPYDHTKISKAKKITNNNPIKSNKVIKLVIINKGCVRGVFYTLW